MNTNNQPALSGAERNAREEQQAKQMRDAAAASAKKTADLQEETKRREQAEKDRLGIDPNGHSTK